MMNFLHLPKEVIRNIISYIPNHWNLAHTCKTMYEILCDIEKFKHIIKIEGQKATDNSIVSQFVKDYFIFY